MKIFAAFGNYDSGSREESPFALSESPLWYEIPDSAISRSGNPFFVPSDTDSYVAFPSAAYRICKLGKSVAPRFAPRYYDEAAIGFSVVNVTLLEALRKRGMPWTRAVAYDRSCLLGNFMPISAFRNYAAFSAESGDSRLKYQLDKITTGIDQIVALVSCDNTIKTGDIILGALSPCGIPMIRGSRLRAGADDLTIFDINVK